MVCKILIYSQSKYEFASRSSECHIQMISRSGGDCFILNFADHYDSSEPHLPERTRSFLLCRNGNPIGRKRRNSFFFVIEAEKQFAFTFESVVDLIGSY